MTEFMIQIFPFVWIILGTVHFFLVVGDKYRKSNFIDYSVGVTWFFFACIFGFFTNVGKYAEDQSRYEIGFRILLATITTIMILWLTGQGLLKLYQVIVQ